MNMYVQLAIGGFAMFLNKALPGLVNVDTLEADLQKLVAAHVAHKPE